MSDFIEIDKKPVIFDHKKCCENDKKACGFLNDQACHYFLDNDDFPIIIVRNIYGIALKHDECKEAWKKAKERQKNLKYWKCDGDRGCSARDNNCDKFKSETKPEQCQHGPYYVCWELVNG